MKNKKIAILGFGKEGKDAYNYLINIGCQDITICDQNEGLKKVRKAKMQLGKKYLNNIGDFDLIIRSPGIPFLHVQKLVQKYVQNSGKKSPEITSVTKLFFSLCKAKIIGVTGTKGKGTTSTLIHNMLKSCGKVSFLAGNIGLSPLLLLHKLKKSDYVVLELSSFQLQDLNKSPHIAVVLMLTSDHLDIHKSVNEYHESKKNIIKYQKKTDIAVLNSMFPANKKFIKSREGKLILVSTSPLTSTNKIDKEKNSCYIKNSNFTININGKQHTICPTKSAKLIGKHNWQNICAAAAAVSSICPLKSVATVISNFKGLPHRLEIIKKLKSITYINDTFSTTPETTIAAVKAVNKPTSLILGGSRKGSSYKKLAKEIIKSPFIYKIVFLGEEAASDMKNDIKNEIERNQKQLDTAVDKKNSVETRKKIEMYNASNMDKAVIRAKRGLVKDSIVLLSPAAASFDLFDNYKHRGKCFKQSVEKLTKM